MVTLTHALATFATVATAYALPSKAITSRQSHPVDFVAACEGYRPAPDEWGVVAAGGVTVEWSGSNLGNGASDRMVIMFDSNCNMIGSDEWVPRSPGFSKLFHITAGKYEGDEVEFKNGWIGIHNVGETSVYWNGERIDSWCDDNRTGMDGLNAGYWRTCNFRTP
ncbi:hypothetical protein D7B24_000342 [Verticillium nonalfalfae]|uniref:Predicted protein n=2 Tax=Verticillium TaxID=1036719 RepID=C9SDU8_VERA1|nr:predicted protein [Verticillium alfalfae VaMs.102]XP_028492720.1 uncharacterized protein D7B24_000342 [Verticillium nonalfalfae]EEY17218.1 predicted protein [Verticillium alfalfae VaMs.102]RNJ54562.1 hypothetical protein D7B24_000342 [Verticillium nonalfalfae]